MGDKHDPVLDLGRLLTSVLDYDMTSASACAARLAGQLGIGRETGPGEAGQKLAAALGAPGPRTVAYDMADRDAYDVLTGGLEMIAADQRHRARNEGGNPRRHEWADLADRMTHQADTARQSQAAGTEG